MKLNAINWFEIYVSDFDRARAFYEKVLNCELQVMQGNGPKMGMFPCDMEKGVGGCISAMEQCASPGPGGTLVYLNVDGELDAVISRVGQAGGSIVLERMAIPPHGFIAIIEDSEGNRVGLHSMS
ncbi:MAG: VOC family protein [Puniceicoccaceae bacterium]